MIPEPPEILHGAALEEWRRIIPLLVEANLVDSLDAAAVAAYCKAYTRWIEAERGLDQTGLIVRAGDDGAPMDSPYLAIANRALDQVRQLSEQIGLTTSGRVRLTGHKVTGNAVARALRLPAY